MRINGIWKSYSKFLFVRGISQTDNPKSVLSAQRVYGGGGKFKVYKNAMSITRERIYHSTTSFHRRQKKFINELSASDTQKSRFYFSFLNEKSTAQKLYSQTLCGKAAMNHFLTLNEWLVVSFKNQAKQPLYSKGHTPPIHGLYEPLLLPIGPDHANACPMVR